MTARTADKPTRPQLCLNSYLAGFGQTTRVFTATPVTKFADGCFGKLPVRNDVNRETPEESP